MRPAGDGPIVIVGAGPTGLGAAYAFQRAGFDDWLLYESEGCVGGLARSFRDERGFTWDLGGHVVFSRHEQFSRLLDDLLAPSGWLVHERNAWVHLAGTWVPYPIQSNLHRLPEGLCERCLAELRARRGRGPGASVSFDDFLVGTFGETMADLFMRPYNRKVWGCEPSEMNAAWIADRVAVPDPEQLARNVALGRDDSAWGPNRLFRFPRAGGTGAIWQALARRLPAERLRLAREVVAVDTGRRVLRFADGTSQAFRALVSTMPLDRLAAATERREWAELGARLRRSAIHVVGIGLSGRPLAAVGDKTWMYFPDPSLPFYRVTHFSRHSPDNVPCPAAQWSLMAELSSVPGRPLAGTEAVRRTAEGLEQAGLIEGPQQVIHTWQRHVEHAYPVPTLGRDRVLRRLLQELHGAGILSRGRFGAWLYETGNMDDCFMQGLEAAAHLMTDAPEATMALRLDLG